MVEEDKSLEDLFKIGSLIHTNNSPLVYRGITKKKHIYEAINQNKDFYYIDTGYFGNFKNLFNPAGKKVWHRVVKNELQKTKIENYPADRWEKLVNADTRLKWQGWKRSGKNILMILPNPKSCNFFDIDYKVWKENITLEIKKYTDRPIIERIKGSRAERNHYTIYDALNNNVHAVVVFNSIAALEAISYGIPAFVTVPCAAWPLANKDISKIENPYKPDSDLIQQHFRSLAYGQFLVEEISNGSAYKMINKLQ